MKTTLLPKKPDAKSPAGADIRYIMDGDTGNMIHSTVPPHQTNRATVHATVSEFWFVLEGRGEIWQRRWRGQLYHGSRSRYLDRHSSRHGVSVSKRIGPGTEVHLYRYAAVAG